MTDLYIATKTQADYDALMRLAEAAGHKWSSTILPTQFDCWQHDKEETVIHLCDNKVILRDKSAYYESKGATIETIPGIANIEAVYRLYEDYLPGFVKHHPIPEQLRSKQNVIAVLCKDYAYYCVDEPIMAVLAVDLKPKESEEVMSEKVKLPKFLCDQISTLKGSLSIEKISGPKEAVEFMNRLKKMYGKANVWLRDSRDNQWKLIDALRNGYEAEPEPFYYVPFVKDDKLSFLKLDIRSNREYVGTKFQEDNWKTKFTMPEILAIDPRYKAFAVKVEEVDECTN